MYRVLVESNALKNVDDATDHFYVRSYVLSFGSVVIASSRVRQQRAHTKHERVFKCNIYIS